MEGSEGAVTVNSEGRVAVVCADVVLHFLDGKEHTFDGRKRNSEALVAKGRNGVNHSIIAGLGIVRAEGSWLAMLAEEVIPKTFVKGVIDGGFPRSTAVLLWSEEIVKLGM